MLYAKLLPNLWVNQSNVKFLQNVLLSEDIDSGLNFKTREKGFCFSIS